MCYSAFRAAPFAHSDVPICLGKEGARSYRERPYGIRTNRFPFTRRIYVTTGKPEIMDWMSSETRDPRHTARARARLLHTPQLFSTFSQRLTYSRRHASRPRKPYLALFTIRGTSSKSPIYDITWLVLGRPYRFSYERPKREHTNGNGEKVAADDEAPSKRKVSAGRVSEQLGRQVRRTGRRK